MSEDLLQLTIVTICFYVKNRLINSLNVSVEWRLEKNLIVFLRQQPIDTDWIAQEIGTDVVEANMRIRTDKGKFNLPLMLIYVRMVFVTHFLSMNAYKALSSQTIVLIMLEFIWP